MADGDVAELQAELDATRQALKVMEAQCDHAVEREALLQGELQNRVRNTLAIVRSVFARTVAAGSDLEDVASHFFGRLETIARYQLPRSIEAERGVDLETLLRDELQVFAFGDDDRITIAGAEVRIRCEMAQHFALAVHELVTNAIKFGALSEERLGLRLSISWRQIGTMLHIEWEEAGVPMVALAPLHNGFGREFLEQALPYQVGAVTQFLVRPGGIFCSIVLPMAEPPAPARLRAMSRRG